MKHVLYFLTGLLLLIAGFGAAGAVAFTCWCVVDWIGRIRWGWFRRTGIVLKWIGLGLFGAYITAALFVFLYLAGRDFVGMF